LDIIELIEDKGHIGIRDISAKTGYPPATVHRIITVLVERGYLRQNQNKNYCLSTRFLELADRVTEQFDIVAIAKPHLERLGEETGENVNLCVLDDLVVVYIYHIHSQKNTLQTFTRLGARVALHGTGVGKVFLSCMNNDELKKFFNRTKFEQYTSRTITNKDSMIKELSMIQKQGYAVDNEEKEDGVRCVAAAIRDHNNLVCAAISISGVAQFLTMKRIRALSEKVIECALNISKELGYRPSDVQC